MKIPMLMLVSSCLILPLPAIAAEQAADAGHQTRPHGRHGPRRIMLEHAEGARVTLWKPDLTTLTLKPKHGAITLPDTGMDNYHAVVVERTWGGHRESLIRYEYLFGRPSKHSPSELTEVVKSDFEIVPDPIPREHYRYHSDQTWGFRLRMHGLPAAGVPSTLRTENGSELASVSDAEGRVAFHLPDDFDGILPGRRDARSAGFTVSAEMTQADIDYSTTLSADYRVNPEHWQSGRLGLLAAGFGLVVGGLIGRVKTREGEKA